MSGAGVDSRECRRGGLFGQLYLLLSLASLFWAGKTVLGRFVAGHVPPITLACLGGIIRDRAAVCVAAVRDWPAIRRHAGLMTLLALTGFSAYNTMAHYGLQYTTALNGLLLQSIVPLFVALWSIMLFGHCLTARQASGICLSLSGVLVIVSHGSLAVLIGIGFNRGDAWFLIALLIYAFYTVVLRSGRRYIRSRSSLSVWAAVGYALVFAGITVATRN